MRNYTQISLGRGIKVENQHFCGTYKHNIDAKNRIFIPAKFRTILGDSFVVFKSPDGCVSIYTHDEWSEILSQMRGARTPEDRRRQRMLYAKMQTVETDKQGRITLSPDFVEHAHLKKDVVVLGADNRVELWDQDEWDSYMGESDDKLLSSGIEF